MTKTISSGLEAHLALDSTTLATLWKITRVDGTIFAFTDHDKNIEYGGVTYLASTGYTGSDISTSGKLNVDNLEVASFFDASSILEIDVTAGLWDRARIDMYRVNYNNISQGPLILRRGETGQFKLRGDRFVSELRGMMQYLANQVGRVYTANCDANLGDARCGVDLTGGSPSLTRFGSVTAVTSRTQFTDAALIYPDDWFQYGLLTWLTGNNAEFQMEVRDSTSAGVIQFQLPMYADIAIGDTFTVYPGCDKTRAMCISKFNNVLNFRGFDQIPGLDRLIAPATPT